MTRATQPPAAAPRTSTPALVLASASPRRAALLHGAGLRFSIRAVDCDETPAPGETAPALARRLAAAKARAAAADDDAIVLGADTVVWHEPHAPLGKPRDRDDARAMLRGLAARSHYVTTAWALAGAVPLELHESTTEVWLRAIDDDELEAYLDAGEWHDKAGGYGIQGRAAAFIPRIVGSHAAVIGLPLCEVVARLHALGVRAQ